MERVHKTHVMLRKRVRVALFSTRKGVEEKLYPEPACHANLIEVYSFYFRKERDPDVILFCYGRTENERDVISFSSLTCYFSTSSHKTHKIPKRQHEIP